VDGGEVVPQVVILVHVATVVAVSDGHWCPFEEKDPGVRRLRGPTRVTS
jgi:hypothetical protein